MSVTVYRSTDSGAPVLNGTSGNGLVNLFDICLVGSGTAYGSLPKKGWTKPYSGTNKGVYLTVDGVAYLRVMHDGSNTSGFRDALVRGAEGATDVDTLIDAFPSTTEIVAGNETWRATDTLDSTARAWTLVADDNWLILSVYFAATAADTYIFGRYSPIRSSNSWPYVISTRDSFNASQDGRSCSFAQCAYVTASGNRLYAMRTVDGVVKSPRATFVTESSTATTTGSQPGLVGSKAPNNDGQVFLSPPQLWVNGGSGSTATAQQPAGFFPNLWSPLHNLSAAGTTVAYGDTFNSAGYDPSAQFIFLGSFGGGKWIIETTDTWQDPLA